MLRKLLGAALVLIALDGFAYPTKAELRKARPLVDELMADHVKAYRDVTEDDEKESAAEKVGDAAVELAQQATGEAAKLHFLYDAFGYYIRGKSYDKAAQCLRRMQVDVKDVPPGTILNLIKNGAKGVTFADAPLLRDLYLSLLKQKAAPAELRKVKLDLKADPTNKALLLRLGEVLAVLGDWQAALESFAKLKGDVGDHARAELEGKDLIEAGDFWWTYNSYAGEAAMLLFRAHSVALYRQFLKTGEPDGLRKNVIEKRLQQLEWYGLAPMASATAKPQTPDLYLVIDLSSGSESDKYPISWLQKMPAGGWTDEYKTEKLVLRRIEPGSYIMGNNQNDESHRVTITKPFYIGVFEVTQRQWELVKGNRPSFWRGSCWAVRPVEQVSYNMIRGKDKGSKWPASADVDEDSFLGILRTRTKLAFDLPTEGQWEYVCRAGTPGDYNGDGDLDKLGRYRNNGGWNESAWGRFAWNTVRQKVDRDCGTDHGTAPAGSYAPNAWGLYDCHGNVWEWCLDWKVDHRPYGLDPQGGTSGGSRVCRGGGWLRDARGCRSAYREWRTPVSVLFHLGFRLSCSAGPNK